MGSRLIESGGLDEVMHRPGCGTPERRVGCKVGKGGVNLDDLRHRSGEFCFITPQAASRRRCESSHPCGIAAGVGKKSLTISMFAGVAVRIRTARPHQTSNASRTTPQCRIPVRAATGPWRTTCTSPPNCNSACGGFFCSLRHSRWRAAATPRGGISSNVNRRD